MSSPFTPVDTDSLCWIHDDLELRGDWIASGLALRCEDMHSRQVEAVMQLGVLLAVRDAHAVVKLQADRATLCALKP